eukprot:CAMPEP_0114412242 /NCGR_PEP_ID=MMETSP0103-20121206/220_1 /TAXON_ID=37642 ORGANISM="Paraphysomonas imperforata, Strain PA2" /NCGR_SAMPLE_ID=MMETSP0103 /ASSEMBLY_ACC=CAM_ASM_000201 /LENGTH=292 /DNA_ID=CAMNT_0001580243 /DNA_START=228 /DNA_END=1107 /DNA_ORIENTATION=+
MPAISKREAEEFLVIVAGGCLLSANAGFINSSTLLQSGYTVTHVTGALTKASILLRDGNGVDFGFVMLNVLGFIIGSAICATIITKHVFHLSRCYIHVFTLGTLLLVLSYLLFFFFPDRRDYVYCVSVTCGMQNAMTTSYSGNVLRTTHMTGTATDIGIVLGRVLKGRYEDIWKLKLMVPMFISFFLGGLLAAVAFHEFSHNILVVNIALFGGTGLLYVIYLLHAIAKFDLKENTEEDIFSETNPNPGGSFEVTSALDDDKDEQLYPAPPAVGRPSGLQTRPLKLFLDAGAT